MRSPLSVRSRQRLRTITIILATALVIAPAAALATHGFNDVDYGDFFHAAVDWMKDNDVTVGCNPPDNTRYCPDDFVTRGEMAVFLERLDSEDVFLRPGEVELDGGDANTLDGKDSTEFLGASAKAVDADKLDGKESSAFLGATDTAVDADELDGKDSTAFLPATGQTRLSVLNYWSENDGELKAQYSRSRLTIESGSSSSGVVRAYPSIPQSMFGASLELVGWEYCYQTRFSTLKRARLNVWSGHERGVSAAAEQNDFTNRTDDACRTLTFDSPVPITDSSFVTMMFVLDVTNGPFDITRSVLIFEAA